MKLKTLIFCALFSMKMVQAQDSIPKNPDLMPLTEPLRRITPNHYDNPQQIPAPKRPVEQDFYLPILPSMLNYDQKTPQPAPHQIRKIAQKPQNLWHLGVGSYWSPRMEIHWMPKNQKIGLHASHFQAFRGAKDQQNSATKQTHLGVFGNYTNWGKKMGFELMGNLKTVHFYGYDAPAETINPADIRQIFRTLQTKLYLLKADYGSRVNYQTHLKSWFWTDNFRMTEMGVMPSLQLFYEIKPQERLTLEGKGQSVIASDSVNYVRHAYTIGGNYYKSTERFRARIGAKLGINLAYQETKWLFFPDISLEYDAVLEKLTLFVRGEGQIRPLNKHLLTLENPFLQPDFRAKNRYEMLKTRLGVRGNFVPFLSWNMAFFYDVEAQFYGFMNQENAPDKFGLVFDNQHVKSYGLDVYLSYQPKNLKSEIHFKWINYRTQTLAKVWHFPERELSASVAYQASKFKPLIGLNYAGRIPYYEWATKSAQFLIDRTNIELQGEYKIGKKGVIYLKISNLINKKYEHFARYEALGLEVILGIKMRF